MRQIQAVVTSVLMALGVIKVPRVSQKFVIPTQIPATQLVQPVLIQPGKSGKLTLQYHEFQTFNNCGPTTLAMILRWYGKKVTGKELGEKIRPYQNPKGNNDDKTVFMEEFGKWAEKYGFGFVARPNGGVEQLKLLVANNFPVVVKTLLHSNEDIAHFRIVTGWNEEKKKLIQSDSYEKKESEIDYMKFVQMWQPYNYGYLVVYRPDQEAVVKNILGEEWVERTAWENAKQRATLESELNEGVVYPRFNRVVANYHLGNSEEAVAEFEQIEKALSRRTLWYQIEPIWAYHELGKYEQVLGMTRRILDDGNKAFSELYDVRSRVYAKLGETEKAKSEYGLAIKYNIKYERR